MQSSATVLFSRMRRNVNKMIQYFDAGPGIKVTNCRLLLNNSGGYTKLRRSKLFRSSASAAIVYTRTSGRIGCGNERFI